MADLKVVAEALGTLTEVPQPPRIKRERLQLVLEGVAMRKGYNPAQPRWPAGSGDKSGEWRSAGGGAGSGSANSGVSRYDQRFSAMEEIKRERVKAAAKLESKGAGNHQTHTSTARRRAKILNRNLDYMTDADVYDFYRKMPDETHEEHAFRRGAMNQILKERQRRVPANAFVVALHE